MKMTKVIFYSLFLSAMSCSAQVGQEAFRVDLQSHGWHVDRGVLNGSSLPQTMDFSGDGSLWVAFPTDASKSLQTRDQSSGYVGKVLHLAQTGSVVSECSTGATRWEYLRLFAQGTDGFTLDAADKVTTYNAHRKRSGAVSNRNADRDSLFTGSLLGLYPFTRQQHPCSQEWKFTSA